MSVKKEIFASFMSQIVVMMLVLVEDYRSWNRTYDNQVICMSAWIMLLLLLVGAAFYLIIPVSKHGLDGSISKAYMEYGKRYFAVGVFAVVFVGYLTRR